MPPPALAGSAPAGMQAPPVPTAWSRPAVPTAGRSTAADFFESLGPPPGPAAAATAGFGSDMQQQQPVGLGVAAAGDRQAADAGAADADLPSLPSIAWRRVPSKSRSAALTPRCPLRPVWQLGGCGYCPLSALRSPLPALRSPPRAALRRHCVRTPHLRSDGAHCRKGLSIAHVDDAFSVRSAAGRCYVHCVCGVTGRVRFPTSTCRQACARPLSPPGNTSQSKHTHVFGHHSSRRPAATTAEL